MSNSYLLTCALINIVLTFEPNLLFVKVTFLVSPPLHARTINQQMQLLAFVKFVLLNYFKMKKSTRDL